MYVTEKEARRKVCPFARQFEGFTNDGKTNATYTQGGYVGAVPHCGADRCMSWEWVDSEHELLRYQLRGDFHPDKAIAISQMKVALEEQKPGWSLSDNLNPMTSHVWWPPHDEQVASMRAAGGYDSGKLKSVPAVTINIQKLRGGRKGSCLRTVVIEDNR